MRECVCESVCACLCARVGVRARVCARDWTKPLTENYISTISTQTRRFLSLSLFVVVVVALDGLFHLILLSRFFCLPRFASSLGRGLGFPPLTVCGVLRVQATPLSTGPTRAL